MKDKKYNLIDFTKRENQKYYVYYIIKENKNIDNPTIKNKFYNISNINLTLSLADLSKIRNKILDKYKNLDLDELVNKIDIENFDIFKKNFDISYEYKINNKIEYREQRIIIFGLKENIDLINEKNTNEFFFDSTYKIIPPHFRPYKFGVLAGIPKKSDNPKLLCFILIKYNDEIAYSRLITYLYENFKFLPKLFMTDFEGAMISAIKSNSYTKDNTIHLKCLFHYSQMIARRLKSVGFFKKKLNKKAIEIIRNLELLVFLDKKNIIDFESIIIKEISKIKNSSKFINYLKTYIFKIINNGYNYSKIINEYLEGNNRSIEKLYLTNNICESINSKINFYLPKRVTSNYDFVNTLSKVFINNTFDNKTIKRHDYITRTLIKIIQDEKLNYKLNWITFDQFKSKEKYIIS